jgi:hypothetical protein
MLFARRAHADEPTELHRPLTLPQLTHRFPEITLESTLALVTFSAVDRAQSSSTVRVDRLTTEIPLGTRRVWFAGAGYGMATGHLADGSAHVVSGNPEIWGRGVWSSAYGLSFGGGLATVVPVAGYDDHAGDSVAEAAVTVRGWERASFDPFALTFRPFLDVRDVSGIFTLQYRQALEMALDAHDVTSSRFAAVGTLYVGIRASSLVTFGAELIEHYRLDPSLDDRDRAYFGVGGMIRVTTRYYQPSLGLMTNIGSPLNALARVGAPLDSTPESFIGLRLGLTFVVDPGNQKETP